MMRLIQLFLSTTALLAAVLFLPDQFSSSHRMTPGLYARVKQIQKRVHNAPNDWFMRQRTWPGTELNRAAVAQAREQALNLRRGARSLDEPWVFAGPSNVGGRITALAVHPSEPNVVYAGAALGGVFKSTDGGLNYVPVFEEDFGLSTGALAMRIRPVTAMAAMGFISVKTAGRRGNIRVLKPLVTSAESSWIRLTRIASMWPRWVNFSARIPNAVSIAPTTAGIRGREFFS